MTTSYIIFSKDRACQLDLLLRSMKKNLLEIEDISVLYTYSNNDYKAGYDIVINKNKDIDFILEQSFRKDVLDIFSYNTKHNIGLACDDNVIFKKQPENIHKLNIGECFSLRLGFNTIMQNIHTGEYQTPLDKYIKNENTINWITLNYNPVFNYGYPFSMDFHIYNRENILPLIHRIDWKNTNELEGRLFQSRHLMPNMNSFHHSISVNIPINNMSGYTIAGQTYKYDNKLLNDIFLSGMTIDLESIENTKIIGCHQELEFKFS